MQDEGGYRVTRRSAKGGVRAAKHRDGPAVHPTRPVSCRNLLIYLTSSLQKTLMPRFHYSLIPGGFLFLGSAETVGGLTGMFSAWKGDGRIYRRVETRMAVCDAFPVGASRPRPELPAPLRPPPTVCSPSWIGVAPERSPRPLDLVTRRATFYTSAGAPASTPSPRREGST